MGVYGGVAAMTGFSGWQFTEPEAEAVARPAARILARHPQMQAVVRDVADPVALGVAIIIPTFARYMLWKASMVPKTVGARSAAPPPQAPSAPMANGEVNPTVDHLRRTI